MSHATKIVADQPARNRSLLRAYFIRYLASMLANSKHITSKFFIL